MIETVKENGLDGIELIYLEGTDYKCFQGKLEIVNIISAESIKAYDKERTESLKAVIDIAKLLSLFATFKVGAEDKISNNGILCTLKELSSYAEKTGVKILVKGYGTYEIGEALKKLLSDLKCDNIEILWDVLRSVQKGENIEKNMGTYR